jgi:hypothetical protein
MPASSVHDSWHTGSTRLTREAADLKAASIGTGIPSEASEFRASLTFR